MEDMRGRGLSKPPLYPNTKSYINPSPSKMKFPSTLTMAFEETPNFMNIPSGVGNVFNIQTSPPHVIPDQEEVINQRTKANYASINEKNPICDGHGKRILTLDEAFEIEKSDRDDIGSEDERKLRRTISNRLSAQRTRMRGSLYISELHNVIKGLQEYVASLRPELETFKQSVQALRMQKTDFEQKLKSGMDKSILGNRQIEEKQAQVRWLRNLYKKQKYQMLMNTAAGAVANSTCHSLYPPGNYQLVANSSIFPCEQPSTAMMEMNADQGGIEQYLNLDAIGISSTQETDVNLA